MTDAVIETISRHTHLYTPFDVYAKALQEFFRGHELTASEWDDARSKMFPRIDRYQKEAYWALMKIARQHGGAFLCDGVGLGKTFVGLMLIERLVLHEGKRVVLFAPKAAKEGVWEPHLREWLPHIGGVGGGADFSNLAVFSHTDLGRKGDFPERFRRIAELADVVIIDEAHHFRNPGRRGGEDDDVEPSRYYRLFDLLDSAERPKVLFMLTATPINNRLSDFRHMAELFTRRKEDYFARTLGVNNLRAHFNNLEKSLRTTVGHEVADVSGHMAEVQEFLASDDVFQHLVVQRSRAYARESQIRETGKATAFPERKAPQVAEYSIRKTYGKRGETVLARNFEYYSGIIFKVDAAGEPHLADEHFEIVQTGANEVAIVSFDGEPRHLVQPNTTRAFWRTLTEVEVEKIDTSTDLAVAKRHFDKLDLARSGTVVVSAVVQAHEAGLLFVDGELKQRLPAGRHAFWQIGRTVRVSRPSMRGSPDRMRLRTTLASRAWNRSFTTLAAVVFMSSVISSANTRFTKRRIAGRERKFWTSRSTAWPGRRAASSAASRNSATSARRNR